MDALDFAPTFVLTADPEGLDETVALFEDGSFARGWIPGAASA